MSRSKTIVTHLTYCSDPKCKKHTEHEVRRRMRISRDKFKVMLRCLGCGKISSKNESELCR